MTYQRVLNRNGLMDGSYSLPPDAWAPMVNMHPGNDGDGAVGAIRRERLEVLTSKAAGLAGDLRRLELDARDEHAIALRISERTGIPRDDVAAVLMEFFAL